MAGGMVEELSALMPPRSQWAHFSILPKTPLGPFEFWSPKKMSPLPSIGQYIYVCPELGFDHGKENIVTVLV